MEFASSACVFVCLYICVNVCEVVRVDVCVCPVMDLDLSRVPSPYSMCTEATAF